MGFMTGQQIYEIFTNGTGPDGLSGGAAIVHEVAAMYGDRAEAIRRITTAMEAAWQGEAAGAAQRGAAPLWVEHELAGMALAKAQELTNRQAGSFADARNAVVPVPPQPAAPDPWAVFTSPGQLVPYWRQVADYNAANQRNVDVMTGYANVSSYNAAELPQSYGTLSDDQAGFAIDPGTPDPGSGMPGSGRGSEDSSSGGRGAVESSSQGAQWDDPPPGAGAESNGAGRPPQQTTPGGFTPTPSGPVPAGTGGAAGSGPLPGGPGSGSAPGTGLVPVGAGQRDGSGGRGSGGRGMNGPGSGGRLGAGPLGGGPRGEPHTVPGRAGAGAAGRGGVLGGMPLAAGGRGKQDIERYAPEFLQDDDPEGLFGTGELTAPPVIGEEYLSPRPAEQPSAG